MQPKNSGIRKQCQGNIANWEVKSVFTTMVSLEFLIQIYFICIAKRARLQSMCFWSILICISTHTLFCARDKDIKEGIDLKLLLKWKIIYSFEHVRISWSIIFHQKIQHHPLLLQGFRTSCEVWAQYVGPISYFLIHIKNTRKIDCRPLELYVLNQVRDNSLLMSQNYYQN